MLLFYIRATVESGTICFSNLFFMKLSFLTVFLLIISVNSFSQTSLGIKAGINLSKAVYLNEYNEQLIKPIRKLKPGFNGGIILNHRLNKIISVQFEILYSQKGLKTEQAYLSKYINSMNYIEVPLSGHYSIKKNKHSNFDIYIGGYAAYWTDGSYKRYDLLSSEVDKIKIDFNNTDVIYKRINAGILLGFVYKINNLSYFIRYTHSMMGSSQKNADALSNHVISFGMNYFIIN